MTAITRTGTGTPVESASATSIVPPFPTGAANGDYVVFVVTVPCTDTSAETSEPTQTITNWTKIAGPKFVNDTNAVSAWGRFKDAGWSTMPTVSTSHAASRTGACSASYSNVDTTTPLDVTAVFTGTTTGGSGATSVAMTGVTIATAGAMLLSFCVIDSSTDTFSPTVPSGMTSIGTTTGGGVGRGMSFAEELRASTGATGTRTWTHSVSTGNGGYNFALRPVTTPTLLATGSISSTGVLTKAITKNAFTGSSTATGALTVLKVVVKVFTGSISATGLLVKKITKNVFTGSSTSTGTFVKIPNKKFTGSITATGFFRKAFPRVYTGTIATTGTLITVALGRVFGRPGRAVVTAVRAAEAIIRIRRT